MFLRLNIGYLRTMFQIGDQKPLKSLVCLLLLRCNVLSCKLFFLNKVMILGIVGTLLFILFLKMIDLTRIMILHGLIVMFSSLLSDRLLSSLLSNN